jgi:subtilase family serine protease
MNQPEARRCLTLFYSANRYPCSDPRLWRTRRIANRWKPAALGLLLIASSMALPAVGQTALAPDQNQIRAEFRTAPRSLITLPIDRTRLVQTLGAVHREAAAAQDLGVRDPQALMEHIQLVLQRPQERQAAFDAEITALHQPSSASYHQWLTPETIGTEFGPSAADIATLTNYLLQEGFTVNGEGKSGMWVDFTGTVAQVEQSFHTEIHNLRLANGEGHFSAISDAQLPEALAPLVSGFVSLSDISPRPTISRLRPSVGAKAKAGAQPNLVPNDTEGGEYYVGAEDFYTIYNEKPLIAAGTNTGSGITIALIEDSNINTGDVTYFRTLMGISPTTPNLTVDHQAGTSGRCTSPGTNGDEDEAVLDTEWAGAVAPGAALLFNSCKNGGSTAGIFLAAEGVIDNNLATIISLSFGNTEVGYTSENTFVSNLWEQATAQGETVVVSAGDAGSANSSDQNASYASHGLAVNGFASTLYDVAAGGTDFQDTYNADEGNAAYGNSNYWATSNGPAYSSALSYVPETPWNDTCASSILSFRYENPNTGTNALCDDATNGPQYLKTGGGGGGVSVQQPRPTWQNGTVYGMPAATGAYNFRLLPDISLFAANGIWAHALDYYESDASSNLVQAGGTSFVAPQLAGVFALIAQKTSQRLGQPNYVLYNMAGVEFGITSYTAGSTCNGSGASGIGTTSTVPASSCIFYDVETSNNSQACSAGSPNCYTDNGGSYGILATTTTNATEANVAYNAGPGFDLATGIGSINIANLVANWQNAAAGGISYTPGVSVTANYASSTYGVPKLITYTAVVSGSGSFPTGSATFSGSPTISTIGNDSLAESSGCASGSACTESTTQAYTTPATLAVGSYTITAAYLTSNESYTTGSGTTGLTVLQQTPAVSVTAVTIGYGTAAANLSATVSYTGSGLPPSGGLTFQVDSGTVVAATCTGSSSPLTCIYPGYNTSALAVGSHTITATALADTNYTSAMGTNTLAVQPLPTITFSVPEHHTMDLPFTVSASSNSSGAFGYSVVSGPATISGNTVTLTGVAGTVVLQASQAASSSYAAGTQQTSFQVVAGSIWLGNSNGALSTLDLTGAPISGSSGYTGGGVNAPIASPLGLAFDSSGNMWVASTNGISKFNSQGVASSSTPYTGGGVSNPQAIAIDGAGQVWVANAGGTVSVLSNSGAAISPSSGYSGPGSTPAGIAIDISGSVWIPSSTANTVTRILGAAAPVVPLATGAASATGAKP